MAWSSIVKQSTASSGTGPAPTSVSSLPRLLDSLNSIRDCSIAVAVVDANALISSSSSTRLITLAARFVSVKEVLAEVRDPASRFHLATLPITVECVEPSEEALSKVVQFARETGDLHSLSEVDLKLLAVTYMLEEQIHGNSRLREKPPPLQVVQSKHVRERDLPGWGSNVPNLEEWEQLSQEDDNSENEDSHILGLKNLSLNSHEKDHPDYSVTKEGTGIKEEASSVKESISETIKTNEHSEILPSMPEFSQTIKNDEPSENLLSTIDSDNEISKDSSPAPEVEDSQLDDGEWQRSISRSTRRKYQKRAARAARKSLVKDNEAQHDNGVSHDEECQSCLNDEGENIDAAVANSCEPNGSADVSDINENEDNDITHGEKPASVNATESEDSWMLCPLSNSTVACITADFPMQNVLLQIGLRVISPNGLQVQQLHRWVLKCEACRHITSDVGRIFCPKCGNGGTLFKTSVTIGPNGTVHTRTRRRPNIRGTRYSLPLPKGGRQGTLENPILREDQLPKKMLQPKKKKSSLADLYTFSDIFEVKSSRIGKIQPPIREALAVFSGKRNPNDCRSRRKH